MTSKTSILLIIQQNPGVDYQNLLSKIAPNYANLNSARAALSRVLKDAVSFGMLTKQNHQLYLTDKGMTGLKVKMHDKLIIKLNQLMRIRSVASNPDPLVQHLSVLLERGKMDSRLLDNARAGVSFSVNDLEKVHAGLQENIRHLQYVEKSLSTQIGSMRELNFPVAHTQRLQDFSPQLNTLIQISTADEVQLEHSSIDLGQNLTHPLIHGLPATAKGNRAGIPASHMHEVVSRLAKQDASLDGLRAYMGLLTVELNRENATIRGPSHIVEKLVAEKKEATPSVATHTTALALPPDPFPFTPPAPPMPGPGGGDDDEPGDDPDFVPGGGDDE